MEQVIKHFQEVDHPYILLQEKGRFYDMVQQTGPAMAEILVDIATKVRHKCLIFIEMNVFIV